MTSAWPTRVAAYRPYATSRPGSWCTLRASRPADTIASASTTVPARFQEDEEATADEYAGSSINRDESAHVMMITCCVCELPIHGMRMKLAISEPAIAPTVFAA